MTPSTKPRQCDRTDLHTEHEFYDGGFYRRQCPGLVADRAPADDAYARGVTEGRRQATERFIAECRSEAEEHRRNHRAAFPPAADRSLHLAIGLDLAINMARHRLLADGPWESGHDDHAGVSDVG